MSSCDSRFHRRLSLASPDSTCAHPVLLTVSASLPRCFSAAERRSPARLSLMAERTMSDEHKAAIAAGRVEAAAVRDYLEALEAHQPRRGRQVSAEQLAERKAAIDAQLATDELKAMKKLAVLQARRDLETALQAHNAQPDLTTVENGFVAHAASYAQRKGIQYATWREYGVSAELLARAGITRG